MYAFKLPKVETRPPSVSWRDPGLAGSWEDPQAFTEMGEFQLSPLMPRACSCPWVVNGPGDSRGRWWLERPSWGLVALS